MGHHFVSVDRSTPFLFPPSVQEWLPDDHLARFVVEIAERLDLRRLEESYEGRGSKAYHPRMLVALLFYGYATGVFSSRKLETASYDSVAMRYVCGNLHPDHDTIATFRRRFLTDLERLFVEVLVLASEMGLLHIGKVSLDGSKVKASASKHKALSWGHAKPLEEQLASEVRRLLEQAEATDEEEDSAEVDLPGELAHREGRLAAIRQAQERIKQRAEERYAGKQAAYEKKRAERLEKEKARGRKSGGRPGKKPEKEGPKDSDQVNLTDPESRIMPTGGKNFEQAFNAQAAVDMKTHLVVGQSVTNCSSDRAQVNPTLDRLLGLPESIGEVTHIVADQGYFSKENVKQVDERGIRPVISLDRQKHNQPLDKRLGLQEASPPEEASAYEQMKYFLQTKEGRDLYAKRKTTVETVFGIIKEVLGFRRFSLRGLKNVSGEWTLVTIAWNLKRIHALQAAKCPAKCAFA
jgi:transposase